MKFAKSANTSGITNKTRKSLNYIIKTAFFRQNMIKNSFKFKDLRARFGAIQTRKLLLSGG
jgi:hypothetical protein